MPVVDPALPKLEGRARGPCAQDPFAPDQLDVVVARALLGQPSKAQRRGCDPLPRDRVDQPSGRCDGQRVRGRVRSLVVCSDRVAVLRPDS